MNATSSGMSIPWRRSSDISSAEAKGKAKRP